MSRSISAWRAEARAVVAAAWTEGRRLGLDGPELKRHISAAYPFGERANWPYKIWFDEVRRACGRLPTDQPTMEAALEGHPFLRLPKGGDS